MHWVLGFPGDSDGKESACNAGDLGSITGLGRFFWRRKWLPTPEFLPEKSHGQRSQEGYSPWGCKELDVTERLTLLLHFHQVSKLSFTPSYLPLFSSVQFIRSVVSDFLRTHESQHARIPFYGSKPMWRQEPLCKNIYSSITYDTRKLGMM